MRMNIGIVGNSGNWEALLEQEGVPWSRVSGSLMPEQYSAVVASDDVHDHDLMMIRSYLSAGGGVLCSAKVYAGIRQTTYQQEFIRFAFSDPSSHFPNVGLIDVQSRCRIAWNANQLRTEHDSFSVHLGMFENGHVVVLPFDASALSTDARASTKSFYSPEHRLPFERVSTVSKGGIRKLVARSLELLHHHRGLPYAHLWYYPNDAQSILVLRVDTDYGSPSEIDELYKVATEYRIPMTWFLDVKTQQLFLSLFKGMQGQETGIHCFEHRTFEDAQRNEDDMRQALTALEKAGLSVRGYAAPFGVWSNDLGTAVQKSGFEYSSEFAFDYDNLPSYPLLETGRSTVLQIPIHPIGIGSLRRQGYTEEQMNRYFEFIVSLKLSVREPLFFYHHPKDGYHGVLKRLFELTKELHETALTMGQYADWWKKRLAVKPRIEFSGSTVTSMAGQYTGDVWLRITKPDGTEAFSPVGESVETRKLSWDLRPLPYALPPNYTRIRDFNYRIPLTRTVDFATKALKGNIKFDIRNLRTKLR
jgi:hypothetical protein